MQERRKMGLDTDNLVSTAEFAVPLSPFVPKGSFRIPQKHSLVEQKETVPQLRRRRGISSFSFDSLNEKRGTNKEDMSNIPFSQWKVSKLLPFEIQSLTSKMQHLVGEMSLKQKEILRDILSSKLKLSATRCVQLSAASFVCWILSNEVTRLYLAFHFFKLGTLLQLAYYGSKHGIGKCPDFSETSNGIFAITVLLEFCVSILTVWLLVWVWR